MLATAFASAKFACLAIALLYLLGGLIALGVARGTSASGSLRSGGHS